MSFRWYLQTCVLPVLILTADRLLSLSSVCNAVHCAHCTVQRSTHYLVRTLVHAITYTTHYSIKLPDKSTVSYSTQ